MRRDAAGNGCREIIHVSLVFVFVFTFPCLFRMTALVNPMLECDSLQSRFISLTYYKKARIWHLQLCGDYSCVARTYEYSKSLN